MKNLSKILVLLFLSLGFVQNSVGQESFFERPRQTNNNALRNMPFRPNTYYSPLIYNAPVRYTYTPWRPIYGNNFGFYNNYNYNYYVEYRYAYQQNYNYGYNNYYVFPWWGF